MYNVLVASKSFGYGASKDDLLQLFAKHACSPQFSPLEEADQKLNTFNGIIIGTAKVNRDLFKKAERLKAIIKYGAGTDNIDKTAAQEYGVQVLNLPGINCETVAEMALGLMFSVARRIVEGDRCIRNETWKRLLGSPIRGKTLGVIGTGAIGSALIRMVSGLNMRVLAYDLIRNEEIPKFGGKYVEFDGLLRQSDFVSLHVPLNEKTFHLIGSKELNQMKKDAFLINTSRGSVVDEKALYEALTQKTIAGAALDVFEVQPASGSPLLKLDNVVCTPHIAAYTDETLRRMDAECVAILSRALEQEGRRDSK
jgi:phosphoglycerate dehydrogenase-like enzyme